MTTGVERRVRLKIVGRVQGVFFRESTRRHAETLGVVGWVRNANDGSVEAVVQGAAEQVEAMVKWCHHGPATARVDAVTVSEEAAAADLSGFRVER